MLNDIEHTSALGAVSRARSRSFETKTIASSNIPKFIEDGWEVEKRNKSSVRMKRKKSSEKLFIDRVWTLLFKMGFKYLSLADGFFLPQTKEPLDKRDLINIVGIDDEVAIAINFHISPERTRISNFEASIEEFSGFRERFSRYINKTYSLSYRRQVVMVNFLLNITLSEQEKKEADNKKVLLFDEQDLNYYENLASHIGPAAKYQFLADILPGKKINGLEIRVPAVKTKMGGFNCYTFSISPEYLLKISYISHRAKGKTSDVNTYQRMISRSRLATIKRYVNDNGIFPTNIVLNLDQGQVQFERIGQEFNEKQTLDNGLLGWLKIRPSYKSAWIIDGQHRLYSYSGNAKASNSKLAVLAFEGLSSSKQAQLFIDINAKQKKVKQSLLEELYAELHWDAEDPKIRVSALISKAVQDLGGATDSPLFNRVQSADYPKDAKRCISLTSLFGALQKVGFHISKTKGGNVAEYGPLWADTNDEILKRTIYILKNWLNIMRDGNKDWWDKGAAEGGGLAMNDGVITLLNVLKSVFHHLESKGLKLAEIDTLKLFELIKPFAELLSNHLASFSEEERKRFRDLRGGQGQTTRTRRCQQAMREMDDSFNPPGLDEFISLEKAQTNSKAKSIIDWIELSLQKYILEELHQEMGSDESQWWIAGIPQPVRVKVTERFEKDDGQRGRKENYFDLMDYRKIILDNWQIFENTFAYQKKGNKEQKTSWLANVNSKRNAVAHSSSGITLTMDELSELERYKSWLENQLFNENLSESNEQEEETVHT